MSLPKVMPSPRELIHRRFCPAVMGCRFMPGTAPKEAVGVCKQLDELLDFNDEMLLHDKARELQDEGAKLRASGKRVANYVVEARYTAATLIDPYEEQSAHDPVTFPDDYHPGEERPDCPGCVKGVKHFHRKKDGSHVKSPTV